jgi:ABC-2 type transport system permease protein
VVIAAFAFHLDLSHANLFSAGTVVVASTLPLMGMAIFVAVLPLLAPEKGEQMSTALQGFLLLVSGVYYPISVLPTPLRLAGVVTPLTYTLSAVRRALLDDAGVGAVARPVGALLLTGAVLIPLGLWVFGRAEQRAKRRGLLERSG